MRPWRMLLPMLLLLGGCIVHTTRRAPPPCRAAIWVEGHQGHHGWRPGHWSCPAPRTVVVPR